MCRDRAGRGQGLPRWPTPSRPCRRPAGWSPAREVRPAAGGIRAPPRTRDVRPPPVPRPARTHPWGSTMRSCRAWPRGARPCDRGGPPRRPPPAGTPGCPRCACQPRCRVCPQSSPPRSSHPDVEPTIQEILARKYVGATVVLMLDVAVIEDPAAAEASLDPIRARLLAELAEPGSATMLAGRVGLARQKVNYHLKALERHGLVELVGERRKGNVTERLMRATAASYVISPLALRGRAPATRLVRDVGTLITGAAKARKRLATYALDGEVRFASAADRAAFIQELTAGVSALIRKYDAPDAEGGRDHRIVVAVHPTVKPTVENQPAPELDQ